MCEWETEVCRVVIRAELVADRDGSGSSARGECRVDVCGDDADCSCFCVASGGLVGDAGAADCVCDVQARDVELPAPSKDEPCLGAEGGVAARSTLRVCTELSSRGG